MKILALLVVIGSVFSIAQVSQYPYSQNFDSSYITPPTLPAGWGSTQNRTPGTNDFTTTTLTPLSLPNAVVSTNAKINQNLISPVFSFSGKLVDSIKFSERRSSTHDSGVLLEASTDGGSTFPIPVSDTLKYIGHTNYFQRRFNLPNSLDNRQNVKFRWRVIGNGTGTTGTVRFDDIYISTITVIDIGISEVSFLPKFPVAGDSISVIATIQNFGLQTVQNFVVQFFIDANFDSTAQSNELFASVNVDTTLRQFDTVKVSVLIPRQGQSELQLIARTQILGDENPSNNQKVTRIIFGVKPFSIVVNEIMYRPTAPEPEWVEIFNTSSDSINIKLWKISDVKTTSRATITNFDYYLKSGEYAIITKDSASFMEVRETTPARVFNVSTFPTLNNDSDAVVIFDQRGSIIDSMKYKSSWGGSSGGKSLERVEAEVSSLDSTNWGSSPDSTGATPGKQNYITPLEHDLQAVRLYSSRALPGEPVIVFVSVKNSGKNPASNYKINLFHDINLDSIPQDSELITSQVSNNTLNPKDSSLVSLIWMDSKYGQKLLIVTIDYDKDLRLRDNVIRGTIRISYLAQTLIINEIMFEPFTGKSEYIELYNRENFPVEIRYWKIHDKPDTAGKANEYKLDNSSIVVNPGEFLVLAADSSILQQFSYLATEGNSYRLHIFTKSSLSLNNDGDDVVLKDLTGFIIDSVRYSPKWHNPEIDDLRGRSLERINPNLLANDLRNWGTCVNPTGGTPGKQNSIFTTKVPALASLSFAPNPFSPDADGFEDHTVISYNLPSTTAMVRIRIFDTKGRLIRTLVNNEPSGWNGQYIWDGMNDDRQKARIGIYVVLLEAYDANGGNVHTVKGVVVLAGRL